MQISAENIKDLSPGDLTLNKHQLGAAKNLHFVHQAAFCSLTKSRFSAIAPPQNQASVPRFTKASPPRWPCGTLGLELLHRLPHGLLGIHLELRDVFLHGLIERFLRDVFGAHGSAGGKAANGWCRFSSVQKRSKPKTRRAF